MEDAPPNGNGNRRNRRKTVSGAIPHNDAGDNDENDDHTPTEAMKFPWSPPSDPTSPAEKTSPSSAKAGHKRTLSNTIFSRLNFLRNSSEEERPPSRGERPVSRDKEYKEPTSPVKSIFSRKSIDDDGKPSPQTSPTKVEQEGALSAALKQSKTRKRKGSLRKTALLGGRRILSDAGGRERKGSFTLLQRPPPPKQLPQEAVAEQDSPPLLVSPTGTEQQPGEFPAADRTTTSDRLRRTYSYEHPDAISSSESGWSEPTAVTTARLAILTDHHQANTSSLLPTAPTPELSSPVDIKSPTSQASYASTTDDDDVLTFSRPAKALPLPAPGSALPQQPGSYFPSASPTLHPSSASQPARRSKSKRSPLSRTISISSPYNAPAHASELPHDYTETSYWGWVILVLTWLTFTVGMGSCLEIWSWAWDVGETPYAPPELEDDPTLPIVGYYPALLVLTGVVAWVWITVAWVGMKYFRHAKIEV